MNLDNTIIFGQKRWYILIAFKALVFPDFLRFFAFKQGFYTVRTPVMGCKLIAGIPLIKAINHPQHTIIFVSPFTLREAYNSLLM